MPPSVKSGFIINMVKEQPTSGEIKVLPDISCMLSLSICVKKYTLIVYTGLHFILRYMPPYTSHIVQRPCNKQGHPDRARFRPNFQLPKLLYLIKTYLQCC